MIDQSQIEAVLKEMQVLKDIGDEIVSLLKVQPRVLNSEELEIAASKIPQREAAKDLGDEPDWTMRITGVPG